MKLIKATEAHLRIAAGDLCTSDLQEFHCMKSGRDPCSVMAEAYDENVRTIVIGSLVLAVGGHSAMGIWFVTTNVLRLLSHAERAQFYRLLKEHLRWIKHYSPAPKTNWVSVDNQTHIRLLTKLGATFQEGILMSPAGFAFKQFWI